MTPTLAVLLASVIVALAALVLYVRHVVRQEIRAAEERLRDDLIATRIISSPPEPPIPRPRPALRYIKGGAVALVGLAAGTLAWTKRHAALAAVTAGGLAAIVVLPQSAPPIIEGLPSAPPSASVAPSAPPGSEPPAELPPTPPTEPPVKPPPTEAVVEVMTTAPPSEEPAPTPTSTPVEEPPASPPPEPPPSSPPPVVVEEPPAVEGDEPPCLLEVATLCVDPTPIVERLLQLLR